MPDRWGLALLGADPALREAVAEACPPSVRALDPAGAGDDVDAVVGVAPVPWPGHRSAHRAERERVEVPYWAVESWHRHPAFLDALREAVARGCEEAPADAHVLVTAPDRAGRTGEPAERVFLREVTEAVAAERPAGRCTLAWDHSPAQDPVTPTAATVLDSLAEAHDRTAVVRASLDPLDHGDPAVAAAAAAAGLQLHQVAIGRAVLAGLLVDVATTVISHEAGA